jgi:hypothetical protein
LNYTYLGNVPGNTLEHTYGSECGKLVVERLSFDTTGWDMDEQNRCKSCGNEIPIVGHLSKSIDEERFLPIIKEESHFPEEVASPEGFEQHCPSKLQSNEFQFLKDGVKILKQGCRSKNVLSFNEG